MRILVDALLRRRHAHESQHGDGLFPCDLLGIAKVDTKHLTDLIADGKHRVETRHRLLKDHADAVTADSPHAHFAELENIGVTKQDPTGLGNGAWRRLDQTQDR